MATAVNLSKSFKLASSFNGLNMWLQDLLCCREQWHHWMLSCWKNLHRTSRGSDYDWWATTNTNTNTSPARAGTNDTDCESSTSTNNTDCCSSTNYADRCSSATNTDDCKWWAYVFFFWFLQYANISWILLIAAPSVVTSPNPATTTSKSGIPLFNAAGQAQLYQPLLVLVGILLAALY